MSLSQVFVTEAQAIQILESIIAAQRNAASGLAGVGADGKISVNLFPEGIVGGENFKGSWNPNTNIPTLTSSTGTNGDYYEASVDGTTTLDGISVWKIGDIALFKDGVWTRIEFKGITRISGKTGNEISLEAADILDFIAKVNENIQSTIIRDRLLELTGTARLSVLAIDGANQNVNGAQFQLISGVLNILTDFVATQDSPRFLTSGALFNRLKTLYPARTGEINFLFPGTYGSIEEPLLDIDDINFSIGDNENKIILYISMGTVPQFITDLGLAASFSTLATDVNRIELKKVSADKMVAHEFDVLTRGDTLGDFLLFQFEDVVEPIPATLVDNGTPGLVPTLDASNGITYNLGPIGQMIGLNAGSFLLFNRTNAAIATFLDSFTQGFGMSFWTKVPTTAGLGTRTIWATNDAFDGTGIRVSVTSNGNVQFYVKATIAGLSPQRIITGTGNLIINDGVINHWAVSWRQSDGQALIWKNGNIVASGTIVADTGVSTNNAFINKSATGNTEEVWYDNLRVRPAYLTQTEVNNFLAKGDPVFASETNLLAGVHMHLRFEDSIDPLPVYLRDSGSEFIRVNYLHEGGGTIIEADGTRQAIGIGLPQGNGGSRLSLDITKSKTSSFLASMSEAFTIAFRVKVKPDSITTSRMIWSNDGEFNNAGIRVNCLSDGRIQFYIGANNADPNTHKVVSAVGDGLTNNDTYQNWVLTYDRATSTAQIYLNGVFSSQNANIVVDNITNFVVGTVNPIIGHGPGGDRYQTIFSLLTIVPRVITEAERTQIFE